MAKSKNPRTYGYISKHGSTKDALRIENTQLPTDFLDVFTDSLGFNSELQQIHLRNVGLSTESG